MTDPGKIVEGDLVRYSKQGNAVIRSKSEEYLLHGHTTLDVGTTVVVQVLSNNWVTIEGWATDTEPEKQGHKAEHWVQVTRILDNGDMLGVGINEAVTGEVFYLGKLRCTIGSRIPMIPLTSDYTVDGMCIALCTDPALWPSDYTTSLANTIEASITAFLGLENSVQDPSLDLFEFEFLTRRQNAIRGADSRSVTDVNHDIPTPLKITEPVQETTSVTVDNPTAEPLGFNGEVRVKIEQISERGNAFGTVPTQHGKTEELFFGSLTCDLGDVVPVLPLAGQDHWQRPAVCTAPELWENPSYIHRFVDRSLATNRDECLDIAEAIIRQATHPDLNFTFPHPDSIATHFIKNQQQTVDNTTSDQTPDAARKADNDSPEGVNTPTESDSNPAPDETKYTETRRRERDPVFTADVRTAYNESCAVCGEARETPNGNSEVEAAHIYPKSEGGADNIPNGIALCKLHHWAFDGGWFSITDDYVITVRDAPERKGYDEFSSLDGDSLHLPDDEEQWPHPQFLRKHRALHGFDD